VLSLAERYEVGAAERLAAVAEPADGYDPIEVKSAAAE
jgi:hypothetical protein